MSTRSETIEERTAPLPSPGRAQAAGRTGGADRRQIAAIAAERDRALAELADAQARLRRTRRTIERYAEELVYVESTNANLQKEAK